MKYATLTIGIIAIILVTILNFYPDKVEEFIANHILHEDFIIAKTNDYYLDNDFSYVKNYTDDVANRQELINYIYRCSFTNILSMIKKYSLIAVFLDT